MEEEKGGVMSMSEADEKGEEENQEEEEQEQSDIKFIFKVERDDVPSTPYYDDGNPELYTGDNMKKREELKEDPIVKDAINEFIKQNFHLGASGIVSKSEYMKVFKSACKKLRPKLDND